MTSLTYKDSGVDLDQYADAMGRLPRLLNRTFSPRVRRLDGGFAGLFQLDFDNSLFTRNYEKPVLVGCSDGVGTKLLVAIEANIHHTVGIDLVAMCVNDALCCGGEPLFFLDYLALPKDDPRLIEQLVEGVSEGCLQADCALLGGETAIMPDLYKPGEYDMSGMCVGVVEKARVIDGKAISPGDVVLGVSSNGLHSNGFSLVRKIVFDHSKLKMNDSVPWSEKTIAEELLTPTLIYTSAIRSVQQHYRVKNVLHGVAHITGGGIAENVARILPGGVDVIINEGAWKPAPVFDWLQKLGNVETDEMRRVFNMGLGLVCIVSEYYASTVESLIADKGFGVQRIGEVVEGKGAVHLKS
ncbi:MAG: phosphoribosylformylglycinamidine cyclo-ligase [bacterium]|nr:phosphoribosylformylglycinamidine cyclo-ligase [bacterium]